MRFPPAAAFAGALLILPPLLLSLSSCDKATEALRKMKESGAAKTASTGVGGQVDVNWSALVDEQADGVRFRKDLPFPETVSVRMTEQISCHEVRVVRQSALGTETLRENGTHETVVRFERSQGRVTLTVEKAGLVIPESKEKGAAAAGSPPPAPTSDGEDPRARLVGRSISLIHGPAGWKTEAGKDGDFHAVVWGRRLDPVAEELVSASGALPRPRWFASGRRWKAGDRLELERDSLPLLFPGKASGKVTLVYEVAEAVAGHPCGRFAVSGSVSIAGLPTIEGGDASLELSISSGKVWCSLIQPVVLREELDTVQTLTRGESKGSGPAVRIQGAIRVVNSCEWRAE